MSHKYVIYADSDKCRGCKKCELACIASHNHMTVKEAVKVRKEFEPRVHVIKTDTIKMPVQCRQCDEAPCARACPTQALVQNDDGIIVMRTEYCAGCGLCVMVCPYGAVTRTFVKITEEEKARLERQEPRLVAVRCDLCQEWRAEEGKEVSACVEACSFGALQMVPVEEYRRLMEERAVPHTALGEDPGHTPEIEDAPPVGHIASHGAGAASAAPGQPSEPASESGSKPAAPEPDAKPTTTLRHEPLPPDIPEEFKRPPTQ